MNRRKIASLVLMIGLVVLGMKWFGDRDKVVPIEITYRLPEGTTRLEVEAPAPDGEVMARFWADPAGQASIVQKTRLPPGERPLDVTVTIGEEARRSQRTIHVERDARVTIDLR